MVNIIHDIKILETILILNQFLFYFETFNLIPNNSLYIYIYIYNTIKQSSKCKKYIEHKMVKTISAILKRWKIKPPMPYVNKHWDTRSAIKVIKVCLLIID